MRRTEVVRLVLVGVLLLASLALAAYFHLVLHTGVVYLHLAYLPVVLASLWWGRWGVLVAIGLSGAILLMRLGGGGETWYDLTRLLLLNVVALCVAVLSEKLVARQQALRRSEERYRVLFEHALAGIMLYRDDRILLVNHRFAELLGQPPEGLTGRSIWDLFHPADQSMVLKQIARRLSGKQSDLHYECRLLHRDGHALWVDLASTEVQHEDRPIILVNVYDITARKQAEAKEAELGELARQQEEQLVHSTRLAELGEMAASLAHELNQPLTGIRNYARNAAYMLEHDAGEADELGETLRQITRQVDRAAKMIGRMRQLSRRERQQLSEVDLNAVLGESLDFLAPQMKLAGVEVRFEPDPALPRVTADRVRLEQVFLNLLTNARQAMESSTVRRLLVRSRWEAGQALGAVVEVVDTGAGFDPRESELLFTPFHSTKAPGKGTGLGLSISLNIVKGHGGQIEARGRPGAGATFVVRLPVAPAGAEPEDEHDRPAIDD